MINRWLFSTNAKDIAILYFIIAIFSGMIGSAMSLIIRLELAAPGQQILHGNNQVFNVIVAGHAIAMIFFFVMPALIGGFGNVNNLINIRNYSIIKNKNNNLDSDINDNLKSYLAGLFEGDGTLWVPEEDQKGTPSISIVFDSRDQKLVEFLVNHVKIGKLVTVENKNFCFWNIKKIEEIYIFLKYTNGFYRTPKYEAIIRAINWINNYIDKDDYNNNYNQNIRNLILNKINYLEIKSIDESNLLNNSWLAGFTDADGNFSISILNENNRKPRIQLGYNLEIRQDYHRVNDLNINISYFDIMSDISYNFNSNLYSRKRDLKLQKDIKSYYSFIVSVKSIINLNIVSSYFNKYPLLSSKYLNFKDWDKLLLLINKKNKSSSHPDCVKLGKELRLYYNKTRKTFTWNHLLNNIYIN